MFRLIVCVAIVLAAPAAFAQAERGRWLTITNIPGCTIWHHSAARRADATAEWTGSCREGKAEGDGTLTMRWQAEGAEQWARSTGTVAGGRFVGRQVFDNSFGTRMEGDLDGRATVTVRNGLRYEGELREGLFHGRGTAVLPNGDRYEGTWENGRPHGRGVYVWANGDRYEGEIQRGERTGEGIRTWKDGTRFEGRFFFDQPRGSGLCAQGGRTDRCEMDRGEIIWLD